METVLLSRPTWRRRDLKKVFQGFRDRGEDGAIQETARLKNGDSGNGATGPASATKMCTFKTFATEVETARISSPRRRRRDQESFHGDRSGSGASLAFRVETARFSTPRRRRRDFSDQGGDGATFYTEAETARLRNNSLRPWWMRRGFNNQSAKDGTDFRDPCPDFRDQILVCPDFRDPCPDFRDQILVCPDFRGPWRDSCPDFPDSNSRRDYAVWV